MGEQTEQNKQMEGALAEAESCKTVPKRREKKMMGIRKRKIGSLIGLLALSFACIHANIQAAEQQNGEADCTVETSRMPEQEAVRVTEDPALQKQEEPDVETDCLTLKRGTYAQITWKNLSEHTQISYQIGEEGVAVISPDGRVTAGRKEGTTEIVATVTTEEKQYQKKIMLTVQGNSDTKVDLAEQQLTMQLGQTYQLQPVLVPEQATDTVSFVSDMPTVVSVDENGLLKAEGYGQADITAMLTNGSMVKCCVTVIKPVEEVSFAYIDSGEKIKLGKGQHRTLYTRIEPEDATIKTINWQSSDSRIVSVTENGRLTAKSIGTAVVTGVTTDGSNQTVSVKVRVTKHRSGTHLSQNGLSIVSTNHQRYTYAEMKTDIHQLVRKYGEFLSCKVVGSSWDQRNLYELILGNPNAKKKVIIQASIHGREYMTAQLVMKQIEFYCANYYSGTYEGKYISELFQQVCFVIVPMTNPDGVTISQFGPAGIRNKKLRMQVQRMCAKYGRGSHAYYTKWKANARGVDLNRNFNQYWGLLSTVTHAPCASGYKGKKPVSEKESKVLVQLANKEKPVAVLSYHAMGEILYWNFGQTGKNRSKELVLLNKVRGLTGYAPVGGRFQKSHSTGYGDWIAVSKKLPTVTIEIGTIACPLPQSQFNRAWEKNKYVMGATASLYAK